MRVTTIKKQVRRDNRFSVYIDGVYTFSFSENELLRSGLVAGQELSKQELLSLKSRSVVDNAYNQAIRIIYRRLRSEWELREYLKRKNYSADIISQTLNALSERGYVNDTDFARRWLENRRLSRPISKRRLCQELRQKHIANDIIETVMANDTTDDEQVLSELVQRKRKQVKYQDDTKLMQYLSRQGFAYSDIKSVMANL